MKHILIIIFILLFCKTGSSDSTLSWIAGDTPILKGDGYTITNICDPSVLWVKGKYRIWCSCVGQNPEYASIAYSESIDGKVWTKPRIVFSPSESGWDNQKVEVPSVVYDLEESDPEKKYKLFYGGAASSHPNLTKIGYAYSPDGINWTRISAEFTKFSEDGLIIVPASDPVIGDAGVVSDPEVVLLNNIFYLYFNSFGFNNDLHISLAVSEDGIHWGKYKKNPVLSPEPAKWEKGGPGEITADVSHPTVIYNGSIFEMWYGSFDSSENETYDGIGYAFSNNGIDWIKSESNPHFTGDRSLTGEETGLSTGPSILFKNGSYILFYSSVDKDYRRVIKMAIKNMEK